MLATLQADSRAQEGFAAVLAMIAGFIDAYSLITYKTYVSFMSGNSTQTGSQIGQGNLLVALPALLAIAFFVIGVFAGTLLSRSSTRNPHRLLFGLIAGLLAVVIVLTHLDVLASALAIALLSLAMGFMNTALTHVGAQSMNLVFMTGTLYRMGQHFALALEQVPVADAQGAWDTHVRRALLLLCVWIAFVSGAFVAGAFTAMLGVWILLLPLAIIVTLAIFSPVSVDR